MTGRTLGRFHVTARLGAGGMGEVYRARDTRLGRDVAIKVLPPAFTADPERIARFDREARLLASLSHPRIAAVHEVGSEEGVHFLVLELAEGETLAARLERGPLQLAEALAVALQLAEALEAAHERGIVHRDLKPANVVLGPEGAVKVLDFGLAKALAADGSGSGAAELAQSPTLTYQATIAGTLLGTAAYMSPEQAKGKPVDQRADLWALGVVLLEMLTGRPTFRQETVSETLAAVLRAEIDLADLPAGTPEALRRLLRRCLARDPRQRLHHAADARLEIEEALAAGAGAAGPASVTRPVRRGPWLAAAVLAVALAGLGGWLAGRREPSRAESIRAPLALPAGYELTLRIHPAVAISGDGRRQVFVAHGTDGIDMLVARDLGTEDARILAGTEDAHAPFFSPDGEWLGYFAAGELRRVPFAGGPSERLTAGLGQDRGGAWSPDGTIVLSPNVDSALYRMPANGGDPAPLTELDTGRGERSHRWPSVLEDGSAVVFTSDTLDTPQSYDDARIEVVSIPSGRRKVLVERATGGVVAAGHLVFGRGDSLFAAPFDADRLELTATPRLVHREVAAGITTGAVHFAVSRTGSLLYFPGTASRAPRQPVWVNADGSTAPTAVPPGAYVHLALAPDGRRVALTEVGEHRNDLWLTDLERGTRSRLTFEGGTSPTWTPDGRRIAFQRSESAAFVPEFTRVLFWKAADGSGGEQVIWSSDTMLSPNAFTPDGTTLIVHRYTPDGSADLWRVPVAGGGEPTPLITDPRFQHAAELSPDGKWIAYTSDESGRYEIYVRPFPGLVGKWQVSSGDGVEPHWARDGRALYFRNRRELLRVPVERGAAFSAGPAERVAALPTEGNNPRTFAVAPDGRILLLQVLRSPTRGRMPVLVTGWGEELAGR